MSQLEQPLLADCAAEPSLAPHSGASATTRSSASESDEESREEAPVDAEDATRGHPVGEQAASPTSWIEVNQVIEPVHESEVTEPVQESATKDELAKKIQGLLEKLQHHMKDGFEDTRVLEAEENFIQDILKVPNQLILTHSCVALGPAGAGKTTLVKALGGSTFEPKVPAGPHLKNRTTEAQSCDLKLAGVSDVMMVLIDTPGWSHDTSTDIKSAYKKILKEKQLVSEHTPHIILFCIPVSMIRQFQEKEAEKMSKQLQELKFDQRFPIKVVPLATKADTEHMAELGELMKTIKARAETAFAGTGAQVEEPMFTKLPPEGNHSGVEELKRRLSKILHEQIESSEFCDLWQKAFAKSVAESTERHCKEFPDNDSALRLFERARLTVANACGIEHVPGLEEKTATVEDLPWWEIEEIPMKHQSTWHILGGFLSFGWVASLLGLWLCNYFTALVTLLLLSCAGVMCTLCLSGHGQFCFWQTLEQCKWKQCRWKRSELRSALVTILVILFILSFCGQADMANQKNRDLHQKLENAKKSEEDADKQADMAKQKLENAKEKYSSLTLSYDALTQCHWSQQTKQCLGLSYLDAVESADDCRSSCCKMGRDICTTWQYQDSNGCWLGIPDNCNGNGEWSSGGQLG